MEGWKGTLETAGLKHRRAFILKELKEIKDLVYYIKAYAKQNNAANSIDLSSFEGGSSLRQRAGSQMKLSAVGELSLQ